MAKKTRSVEKVKKTLEEEREREETSMAPLCSIKKLGAALMADASCWVCQGK